MINTSNGVQRIVEVSNNVKNKYQKLEEYKDFKYAYVEGIDKLTMEKIENKEICASCGGFCCKKCGCDYFVSDLESTKIEYLESLLDTGRVSIVAFLDFKRLNNNQLICTPFLYLRARNINRGEIDLLSFKTTCASLENNGCHYDLEHRPSGGAVLEPSADGICRPRVDLLTEVLKWSPYQKILGRIVKRRTGLSVLTKLRVDAENLFFDILTDNIDGVMEIELLDVRKMLPMLIEAFPEEYKKAKKRSELNNVLLLKK